MPLTTPIDRLGDRYDVVVVGSGYGGAVCAARLAMTGQRVCVLERGREFQPGDFPETAPGLAAEIQLRTDTRRVGPHRALMDVRLGSSGNVVIGCGLGGGSLINAGVVMPPPPAVFEDPRWPAVLRGDALSPYLERAERMLGATTYPDGWPRPSRAEALEKVGAGVGGEVERANVTISFRAGANHLGFEQSACTMCGNCVTGCNHGAKGTLATSYLPLAVAHGAQIFTGVEVLTVLRGDDGEWVVSTADRPGFVRAGVVILAAGALGSTEILFRSRSAGLRVSERLGEAFTGNGGAIAFSYAGSERIAGWATRRPGSEAEPPGPTILGMLRLDNGQLIEDGVVPTGLAELTAAALALRSGTRPGFEPTLRRLKDLVTRAHREPAGRTLMLLLVSDDDAVGNLVWTPGDVGVRVGGGISALDPEALRKVAAAVGGRLVTDPLAGPTARLSVHPLGGTAMGHSGRDGVVDDRGRVFAGASDEVHDGLYVADGAVVPRRLVANPLLTIAALAERSAELIIAERGWRTPSPPTRHHDVERPGGAAPAGVGLRFTERLRGYLGRNTDGDPRAGTEQGRLDRTPVELRLTLETDRIPSGRADLGQEWTAVGTVLAPALAPRRLRVVEGRFWPVAGTSTDDFGDACEPIIRHVEARYELDLLADDGRRFVMVGSKQIHAPRGVLALLTLWRESTTLPVVVRERTADGDRIVAAGTVAVAPSDLVRQLASARLALPAVANRLAMPAHRSGLVGRPAGTRRTVALRGRRRPLRLPAPAVRWCAGNGTWHAGDDVGPDAWLRLIRYEGGERGPVMLAPGFSMASTSFLVDTIDENLVEHLVRSGYDVWLFDYRASIDLPTARSGFTIDDIALVDWPVAVAEVLRQTRRDDVHALGHCVGSLTLMMALAAGLRGIRSAICMQTTLHPVASTLNVTKAALPIGQFVRAAGARYLRPARSGSLVAGAANALLRTVPAPPGERCGQAICDWVNALYGSTHRHAQLNDATHEGMDDLFDVGSVLALEHLGRIVGGRCAVDAAGTDTYLKHPERLRLPILLVQGECNDIFRPAGTMRTLEWLTAANGPTYYDRIVLPGYAHLDALIGKSAAVDVYPLLSAHLDRYDGHRLEAAANGRTRRRPARATPRPSASGSARMDKEP